MFNTRQLNVQHSTMKLMYCFHANQHLWDVAMATRVLCIVAMETVTVQIQYLRRCSWSHKVATPGLIDLHVHINHTAIHLHLNLKGSRITTTYITTPNMCLLCYFTRRIHDIVGVSLSEYTKLQMWNRKLAAILSQCIFPTEAHASTPSGAHTQAHSVGLSQAYPLKATNQYEGRGSPLLTQAF